MFVGVRLKAERKRAIDVLGPMFSDPLTERDQFSPHQN